LCPLLLICNKEEDYKVFDMTLAREGRFALKRSALLVAAANAERKRKTEKAKR
jgi:hypothetical protein